MGNNLAEETCGSLANFRSNLPGDSVANPEKAAEKLQ